MPRGASAKQHAASRKLSRSIKDSQPCQLHHYQRNVRWIQQRISFPESFRLHAESEEPLHSPTLKPGRRLTQFAGDERKGCSYRQNRHLHTIAQFVRPHFLTWTTKAGEEDGGAGLPNS